MKHTVTTFLIALMMSLSLGAEVLMGKVVGVSDGDTVKVLDASNGLHKIRLDRIDAPEKKQAYGEKAKQHLSEMIFGREVASENPKLISCPDCGHSVSRRAFMCPQCGCRAEAIEQAVKEIESKPKPRIPDRIVRANFGREVCDALPVKMTDGSFVVLPLEKVLDIETLEFSFVSTNATIGYSIPEVAVDQPIIRFPITETNLLFATVETNICSELAAPNAVKLSSASGWQQIQPKALKNHGKILLKIKAGEAAKLPPKAHPYYKQLAERWSKKGD